MTDDDAWAEQDERAKLSADFHWQCPVASGQELDPFIARTHKLELEAQERGHTSTARWWNVIGTTLGHRQKLNDEAITFAMEDAGLVDDVWPNGYDQALDWNEIDDWGDGPDLT